MEPKTIEVVPIVSQQMGFVFVRERHPLRTIVLGLTSLHRLRPRIPSFLLSTNILVFCAEPRRRP